MCVCNIRRSYRLRELYEADFHKPGIYRSGKVWANACDVFRRMPSRIGRGRRAAVDFVVCFGGADFFPCFFFVFFFKQKTAYEIRLSLVGSEMCIRDRPKTHHEIHSSPATASNSRRHARKHVTRVSPYSPASMDPGFVEIGLVQLSQSVKTTNVTYTLTNTQTG